MKFLLLVLFFVSSFSDSFGQHQKLLYSSSDIGKSDSLTIRKIRGQRYGKYVKVVNVDGTKIKIPKDSLWGYTDRKGHIFHYYNKLAYRVIFKNGFIKYNYQNGRYSRTLYSKSLDSEMVHWKRNL